jgi:hypothetical protein
LSKQENGDTRFVYRKLLNGYKKFDPTRGASYILDLLLLDKNLGIEVHKRVNVMRPLGLIEIIPMPYVTENAKINMVVTFSSKNDLKEIENYFLSYEKYVLSYKEISEKINLFVIFLSQQSNTDSNINDKKLYTYLNDTIKELTKKYTSLIKTNSRILQFQMTITNETIFHSNGLRQLTVADYISSKLPIDGLILFVTSCAELQPEFLNRVRLNTIKGNQIFFPIPFNEYSPNIIYPSRPFPLDVEIHKNVGYFNLETYEYVSYYNLDYILTRNEYLKNLKIKNSSKITNYLTDLYDLFSTNQALYSLRATDQALKCRWSLINDCDKKKINNISNNEKQRCLNQRDYSLGTKTQLAVFLMKNFDLLNKK